MSNYFFFTKVSRQFNGETTFQQMVFGQLDIKCQKKPQNFDPSFTTYANISSKYMKDLHVKAKITKLLE